MWPGALTVTQSYCVPTRSSHSDDELLKCKSAHLKDRIVRLIQAVFATLRFEQPVFPNGIEFTKIGFRKHRSCFQVFLGV